MFAYGHNPLKRVIARMWAHLSGRAVATSILGSADGVTSIAGVIAGGAGAGVGHTALAVTAIGGALAATVSMAGAELLSEAATDWGAIGAMGAGTLFGSALPAIPLLAMGGTGAWMGVMVVALAIGVLVGLVRARTARKGFVRAVGQTLLVLGAGALVGYGAGRLL